MLGFKRRMETDSPLPAVDLAQAQERLQLAEADLAAAPWDARRREEYRQAHNALIDATAVSEGDAPTSH